MPNYNHTNYGDNPEFRRKSQKVFVDRVTSDVILRLHETDIVRVRPNGDVILCTGGWATHKTLHSMNDALELMDMWVESSGNIPRGNWLVYDSDGTVIPYDNDKINYVITIPGKSSEARQRAQWLAEAYNVPYTPGQQQQQAPRPRVMSAPPRPAPQQAAAAAAAAAQPSAMAWPAAVQRSPPAAANGTLTAAQAAGRAGAGSWAKIVKPEPPPAAVAAAAASRTRTPAAGPRITGPGGASSSLAAAAAVPSATVAPAPAGPAGSTITGAPSPTQGGGLRALEVARSKLQASKTQDGDDLSAQGPTQLAEHIMKLGINQEELEDDAHLCVVCMEHPRVTVLVPCGHMALCKGCCDLLVDQKLKANEVAECPMCRHSVEYHVEVDE